MRIDRENIRDVDISSIGQDKPAYFMATDTTKDDVLLQMRYLELEYDHNPKDLDVEEPFFLVFRNKAYACNSRERTEELLDCFGLDREMVGEPHRIKDILDRQEVDLKLVREVALSAIPPLRRTTPVCYEAVISSRHNFKDIPGYIFSREFVGDMLRMDPCFIGYLPVEKLSGDMCLEAVGKDSGALIGLHDCLKTPDVCKKAVERAWEEIPDKAYLQSVIAAIPRADVHIALMEIYHQVLTAGEFLEAIPEKVLNGDIYQKAFDLEPQAIIHIPDRFRSQQMALSAFRADAHLLYHIPHRYKTREQCRQAIRASAGDKAGYTVLGAIPYPDIILQAIGNEFRDIPVKELLQLIPGEVMDERLAMEVIRKDASCLPQIPFRLKDEQLCLQAIRGAEEPEPLYAIPGDAMTGRVCTELVGKFPRAIGEILPEEKRTPEVCLIAVKQDESLKNYVPLAVTNDPGMNIYRFAALADKQVALDARQVKALYEGKEVEIRYTEPTTRLSREVHLAYDSSRNVLNYFDTAGQAVRRTNRLENTTARNGKGMKA